MKFLALLLLPPLLLSAAPAATAFEPDGAYGRYRGGDGHGGSRYQPQGEFVDADGLDLYVAAAGQPGGDGATKAVVWAHDIYGWREGRTFELVDRLAGDTEYMVVLPNLYRDVVWPDAETYKWTVQSQASPSPAALVFPFFFCLAQGVPNPCIG